MPKLYEAWPGNNEFYCKGCVTGPGSQIGGLICMYTCMIGAVIPFSIIVLGTNWNISPALPIMLFFCLIATQIFYFLTSCTDPGIIPRRPFLQKDPRQYKMFLEYQGNDENKYCQTCQIYRPQRASHCSTCQNCVQIFDHHCTYVGNCIGKRNYRFFIIFLVSALMTVILFVINLVFYIIKKSDDSISRTAVIVVVAIIGAVLGLPLLIFLSFHIFLALSGKTTHEMLKKYTHEEGHNKWCNVLDPMFNPYQQISQQQLDRLTKRIEEMRQPNIIVSQSDNPKTQKQLAPPK